jgi:hypothetical protein
MALRSRSGAQCDFRLVLAPQLLQCREVRLIPIVLFVGWERDSVRELPVLNSRRGVGAQCCAAQCCAAQCCAAQCCAAQCCAAQCRAYAAESSHRSRRGESAPRAQHGRVSPHSPTPTATEPATPADHTVPPASGPQSSAARAGRARAREPPNVPDLQLCHPDAAAAAGTPDSGAARWESRPVTTRRSAGGAARCLEFGAGEGAARMATPGARSARQTVDNYARVRPSRPGDE